MRVAVAFPAATFFRLATVSPPLALVVPVVLATFDMAPFGRVAQVRHRPLHHCHRLSRHRRLAHIDLDHVLHDHGLLHADWLLHLQDRVLLLTQSWHLSHHRSLLVFGHFRTVLEWFIRTILCHR